MSNYHILSCTEKDHEIKVAFHIAIPDTNNAAGVSWRTALSQWRPSPESSVPWLEADYPDEYASMQTGEIFEHLETVPVNADLSNSAKLAIIDSKYTALSSEIKEKLQKILKYWGYNHDVT
jgi:hypothetical protein